MEKAKSLDRIRLRPDIKATASVLSRRPFFTHHHHHLHHHNQPHSRLHHLRSRHHSPRKFAPATPRATMSHLSYYCYPGFGERAAQQTHYSQAVRLPGPTGDIIQISGQGGWDRATSEFNPNWAEQIDQAFENVDVALKDAGGKYVEPVFCLARLASYLPFPPRLPTTTTTTTTRPSHLNPITNTLPPN